MKMDINNMVSEVRQRQTIQNKKERDILIAIFKNMFGRYLRFSTRKNNFIVTKLIILLITYTKIKNEINKRNKTKNIAILYY